MSALLVASVEAGQPLSSTSDSAAKQEWGQLQLQAAASPSPTPAKDASVDHHQPQSMTSSQHKASADAEVQQPDITSQWSIHSLADFCHRNQQDAACTSANEQQQQGTAQHPSLPSESRGCVEQPQGCSHDASCPDSVRATGRAFREHCAAGR